ncbi:MAG: hypothetical protein UU40_C0005G0015 [Candidatus Uhrbacteria bacterium GW2011_GWD2_41_121]|uniref:RNA polymerase alpha subunit C-terminal domain-containing protein n=1 Tax=Candidatus Uhrbacteria bacterium GW2011_GWC1_41_20 TaxID=1618983 RepID=A0A0G0VF99_9BACT|nr:MAG: hypothetical protein UT52_C0007G0015 [Candidatus Uhrbacteria bacterium GW2011_GWE1_39_46]KKR64151.1 MAG: hypothetical protein UU04_C0005G0015 [Candidatus Uhrbacteria bacterium GW2011_GWC2_40_450]KKR90286.1 MAG: hypothetical protein UU40_C0005G0015 [Candidatus Uhrbacteria bacterium GW2011_GWD2_41_121]KKR95213.1 MAG: hypothetical protein UU46_C0026G0015 [Candidatus Uhrbacteria bacterium GW2011_GWD1_41_16]KKR99508.1 MAG: hypothetical protein UU50_C0005G0015 [Candidatus Uhrbacteria bacteriu
MIALHQGQQRVPATGAWTILLFSANFMGRVCGFSVPSPASKRPQPKENAVPDRQQSCHSELADLRAENDQLRETFERLSQAVMIYGTPEQIDYMLEQLPDIPNEETLAIGIDALYMTVRATNVLWNAGIHSVGQLIQCNPARLRTVKKMGPFTYQEVLVCIQELLGAKPRLGTRLPERLAKLHPVSDYMRGMTP